MNSRCQFIGPNPSLFKVVIFSIVLSYDAATRSLLMVFLCTNANLLKIETDDCSKKLDCFHNYHFFFWLQMYANSVEISLLWHVDFYDCVVGGI